MIKLSKTYRTITGLLFAACVFSVCANSSDEDSKDHVGNMPVSTLINNYPAFANVYHEFGLTTAQADRVKNWPADLTVDIFFGTWCHDSERQVPKMLKILEKNTNLRSNLIALNNNKTEPGGRALQAGVKYTPTFIFYQNKQEIGRIIEHPAQDLITDISDLLAKAQGNKLAAQNE